MERHRRLIAEVLDPPRSAEPWLGKANGPSCPFRRCPSLRDIALPVDAICEPVPRSTGLPRHRHAVLQAVEDYLALMEIAVVAVLPETARIALDAFEGHSHSLGERQGQRMK